MTTRTFRRAPAAFTSLDELLDWSESNGPSSPSVYRGPDGTIRGSVEVTEGWEDAVELARDELLKETT